MLSSSSPLDSSATSAAASSSRPPGGRPGDVAGGYPLPFVNASNRTLWLLTTTSSSGRVAVQLGEDGHRREEAQDAEVGVPRSEVAEPDYAAAGLPGCSLRRCRRRKPPRPHEGGRPVVGLAGSRRRLGRRAPSGRRGPRTARARPGDALGHGGLGTRTPESAGARGGKDDAGARIGVLAVAGREEDRRKGREEGDPPSPRRNGKLHKARVKPLHDHHDVEGGERFRSASTRVKKVVRVTPPGEERGGVEAAIAHRGPPPCRSWARASRSQGVLRLAWGAAPRASRRPCPLRPGELAARRERGRPPPPSRALTPRAKGRRPDLRIRIDTLGGRRDSRATAPRGSGR